jgi:hypothetical protein
MGNQMKGTTVVSALSMTWGVAGAMSFFPLLATAMLGAAIARQRIRSAAVTLELPDYAERPIP